MNKMQFYGLTSLILVGIAIVLGVVTIFQASLWLGMGYLQLVLWKNPILLVTFWILCGIAVTQIRSVVCLACRNVYCPLNQARRGVRA